MFMSSAGLRSQKGCADNARQTLKGTDPDFSSERASHSNKPRGGRETENGEKLVAGPGQVPDTKTDWPTDCRS
jgi:hypothetical protein